VVQKAGRREKMKKIFISLFALLTMSCSKPEKLSVYRITTNYDEISLLRGVYTPATKTDTIHSLNDSTAYLKALINTDAQIRTYKQLSSKLGEGKVYYFQITDSLGFSLGKKLGPLKIEEINKMTKVVSQEAKDKFLF
jgi:hypothetical protein